MIIADQLNQARTRKDLAKKRLDQISAAIDEFHSAILETPRYRPTMAASFRIGRARARVLRLVVAVDQDARRIA